MIHHKSLKKKTNITATQFLSSSPRSGLLRVTRDRFASCASNLWLHLYGDRLYGSRGTLDLNGFNEKTREKHLFLWVVLWLLPMNHTCTSYIPYLLGYTWGSS